MTSDKLGIYRTNDPENEFIVVIGIEEPQNGSPLHTSNPLARDEAKNLLRHYNLTDTEIDFRLTKASVLVNTVGSSK